MHALSPRLRLAHRACRKPFCSFSYFAGSLSLNADVPDEQISYASLVARARPPVRMLETLI
jgi:hypothetical protein